MRDVVNLVDGIRFDSSEEIHILGRLYETLLREMRDAAGDSGEFYTLPARPRGAHQSDDGVGGGHQVGDPGVLVTVPSLTGTG